MRHTMTSFRSLVSAFALLILSFGATAFASQPAGGSASGAYQYSLEDGYTKYVEFDARSEGDGSATGSMTITDEAPIPENDVDGTGDPELGGSRTGFTLRVNFDGMTIDRNLAVMSGTVRDSNINSYIGQRVLLIVEDNGDNGEDKLAWGVYKPSTRTWTPADAEVRDDNGASLTWTATDAERRDDVGIPSSRDESITCQSFPLSSYTFFDARGAGNILVQA